MPTGDMTPEEFKQFQDNLREAIGNTYTVEVGKILTQEEAENLIRYIRVVHNDPDATIQIIQPLEYEKPNFDFEIIAKNNQIILQRENLDSLSLDLEIEEASLAPTESIKLNELYVSENATSDNDKISKIYGENWIVLQNRLLNAISDLNQDELEKVLELDEIAERLEQVKKMRLASRDIGANKLAERPHQFRDLHNPTKYIIVPRVSSERRKYVPLDFLNEQSICTDRNQMIPNGTMYEFGILNSIMHNEWMRLVTGRLESRYNYSGTIVYNTFPFPTVTDEQKKHIEHLAEEILLTREDFAGETLAKLYDPDTMPESLKIAHQNLDDAVDELYHPKGFADTASRLAHLLERYESLINTEKKQAIDKKAKKAKMKKE